MSQNFEFLNNFLLNSKPRIDFFWHTVFGRTNKEILYLFMFFLPLSLFFMGVGIITEKLNKHLPLYFIGLDKFSSSLPNIFSMILNVSLWISYFLLSIAIIVSFYKPLMQKMDVLKQENSEELTRNFSPSETTLFSSLRISEELDKYANAKMPSDFGLGGDLDWIEGIPYKVLTGKRPTGSYSGPNIDSNSFFAGLKDGDDIVRRLNLYDWYDKEDVQKDRIIPKLLKLKDYILKTGVWHDYASGALAYRSLAQTFLAANLKQNNVFKDNLDKTLEVYEQYNKSKAPLRGIPHYTVKFVPKVVLTAIIIISLILFSTVIIFFLPKWVVVFSARKLNIILDINSVKEVINSFFVLLSLLSFLLLKIWKG